LNLSWFVQRKWFSEKQLIYATVSLVSFATLLLELLQTRILSFIFWYHVVYLTIAMALLGFGISGTLVAVFADRMKDRNKTLSNLLLAFAGTSFVSLLASYLQILFGNDVSLLGLFKVIFLFVVFLFPFVFAGAIFSICLSSSGDQVGKLYAADLLSAGLACIAFFFLLPLFGPLRLIGLITCSMTLLAYRWIKPTSPWSRFASLAIAALGFSTIFFASDTAFPFIPQASKEYIGHLAAGGKLEKTIWTPLCRLDVIGLKGARASEQKTAIAKDSFLNWKIVTQDGTAHTLMTSLTSMRNNVKFTSPVSVQSLVYTIKKMPLLREMS
jgi:MFS family permease